MLPATDADRNLPLAGCDADGFRPRLQSIRGIVMQAIFLGKSSVARGIYITAFPALFTLFTFALPLRTFYAYEKPVPGDWQGEGM